MNRVEEYKTHLKLKGFSIAHYGCMAAYFKKNNEFTKDSTTKYILYMMDSDKYQKTTINNYIKAFNSYAKFIGSDIRHVQIEEDKKTPRNITKEFLDMEVIPIIKLAYKETYIKQIAIIYYMFFTGSRLGDVVKQKRENINFVKQEILIINTKSKHERIIPMVPLLADKLKLYFRIEAEEKNCFNISRSQLTGMFRMLKVNFPEKHFKSHLMRGSFATHFYNSGLDLYDIQYLLGHSNVETTLRYVEMKFKRIKEKMLKIKKRDLNNVINVQEEKIRKLEKLIEQLKNDK